MSFCKRILICTLAVLFASSELKFASAQHDAWRPYTELEGRAGGTSEVGLFKLFFPLWQEEGAILFADVRSYQDDRSAAEGSWGLAYRTFCGNGWVFGINGFFDYGHTASKNDFSQGAYGFELLNEMQGLRANIYLPSEDVQAAPFASQVILDDGQFLVRPGLEAAYQGMDVETEHLLWFNDATNREASQARYPSAMDMELWAAAGWFHFENHSEFFRNINGPRLRAELRLFDIPLLGYDSRLVFAGQYQYDAVRGGQGNGSLAIRIPFGPGGGRSKRRRLKGLTRRMVAPIERRANILTHLANGQSESAQLSYGRVAVQSVVVVDANEDLVTAVKNAGANSLVILDGSEGVFAASGTIELATGQTIIGGGSSIGAVGSRTGTYAKFHAPGIAPVVQASATSKNTFEIADYAGVVGLTIEGSDLRNDATAIYGYDIMNFLIQENSFRQYSREAVQITLSSDTAQNNRVNRNAFEETGGVQVLTTSSSLASGSLEISENTFQSTFDEAIQLTLAGQAQIQATMASNVIVEASGNGIDFSVGDNAQLTAVVEGNMLKAVGGDALSARNSGSSVGDFTINNNEISGVTESFALRTLDGVQFELDDDAQVVAQISGNRIANVAGNGIYARVQGDAMLDLATRPLASNSITDVGDAGIALAMKNADNGQLAVHAIENQVANTGQDGFNLFVDSAGTATATIEDNEFINSGVNGAGWAGVRIHVPEGGGRDISIHSTIRNNVFVDHAESALLIETRRIGGGNNYLVDITTDVVDNTFRNNGQGVFHNLEGGHFGDTGGFTINTNIRNNTFEATSGDAVGLFVDRWIGKNFDLDLNVTENSILDTGGNAVNLLSQRNVFSSGAAELHTSVLSNTISNTTGGAVVSNMSDDVALTLDLSNNVIADAADGFDITNGGSGPHTVVINGNQISNVSGTGIRLDAVSPTTISNTGDSNAVSNATNEVEFQNSGNVTGQIRVNSVPVP